MKIRHSLALVTNGALLTLASAIANLTDIGYYKANGVYEPGYVNYTYPDKFSSSVEPFGGIYSTGFVNDAGIYEAYYLNYPVKHSDKETHQTEKEYLSLIGYFHPNGVYEPGYVNYNFSQY